MAAKEDSYCGIYCGACSVLIYGEAGDADSFVACLANVPPSELRCSGCKSGTFYAGCRACPLRDCAVRKGVSHCVACADYPCKMYKKWRSAVRILPHVGESAGNLETVKESGIDAWLALQKNRWSCPQCGRAFSWYAQECTGCGRTLTSEAHQMKGLRRLVCRLVLPVVFRRGQARAQRQGQTATDEVKR